MNKILFVANEDSHIYYFHMNDINLLEKLGFQVDIAGKKGCYTKAIMANRRMYHHIPFSRKPLGISNIKAFIMILGLMRCNKYDMVHVHNVVASVITRIAAKIAGIRRIVYTAHGFPFHPGGNKLKNFMFSLIEKIMGYFTEDLIVMNSWDYHMALKMKIVNPDHLFKTNGVGVDIKSLRSMYENSTKDYRKILRIKESTRVIGCVAELIPRKNHQMIIDSAQEVIRSVKDVVFLFAGDGSYGRKLEEIISKKGLNDYFIFPGRIEDIHAILKIMDVLVLVSIYEGLPRAIQEGMAAGLPIIASDIRGNSDLIEDGVNGYLVDLRDTKNLGDKIIDLLKDAERRSLIGNNNILKIEENYSIDIVQKQMRSIYTRILGVDDCHLPYGPKVRY